MPWGLTRFHHSGQNHFVTFCCYHRRRLFTTDASRRIFESALERVRCSFRLQVYGYVVMGAGLPLVLIFLALSPKTAAPLFLDFGKGGDIKCFPREILELLTHGAVGKKKSTNSWPQAPTL